MSDILIKVPMLESSKAWYCEDCDEFHLEEPEFDKLYECNECSNKFRSSNGNGRNGNMCPECGNKFGSRVDEGDKNGSPICPSCDTAVADEVAIDTCPIDGCEYHGNPDEIDTDAYLKHFFEDHFDALSYETPR